MASEDENIDYVQSALSNGENIIWLVVTVLLQLFEFTVISYFIQ
jgi:hypothetical protein